MASPPSKPLITDSGNKSYFEKICELAKEYLEEDTIILNFDGYEQTVEEYKSLSEEDISTAWKLTKELNAWSEYFSDISNLIQKKYLDSETEKMEIQAIKSIEHNEKSVSAGDRHANTDPIVIQKRKKRNILKSLYDELTSKIKFLERAYYHCKSTCEWANRIKTSYTERPLDGDTNG